MNFLKFLPLIALGRDVKKAWKETTGKETPFWATRRFIGTVTALVGAALSMQYGYALDHVGTADQLFAIISNLLTLWGTGVAVKGHIKRKKKGEISDA